MANFQIEAWHTNNKPSGIRVMCVFATLADAEAVASTMPKMVKARTRRLFGSDAGTGFLDVMVDLCKNGVNGGVNESGIKRYRQLCKWCDANGHTVEYRPSFKNSYPSLAELDAAIA